MSEKKTFVLFAVVLNTLALGVFCCFKLH